MVDCLSCRHLFRLLHHLRRLLRLLVTFVAVSYSCFLTVTNTTSTSPSSVISIACDRVDDMYSRDGPHTSSAETDIWLVVTCIDLHRSSGVVGHDSSRKGERDPQMVEEAGAQEVVIGRTCGVGERLRR